MRISAREEWEKLLNSVEAHTDRGEQPAYVAHYCFSGELSVCYFPAIPF